MVLAIEHDDFDSLSCCFRFCWKAGNARRYQLTGLIIQLAPPFANTCLQGAVPQQRNREVPGGSAHSTNNHSKLSTPLRARLMAKNAPVRLASSETVFRASVSALSL